MYDFSGFYGLILIVFLALLVFLTYRRMRQKKKEQE